MIITSDNPKTFNKTFSNWWLLRIEGDTIYTNTPEQTFNIVFIFVRGNQLNNGQWELSPFSEDIKMLHIEDVFAFAASEASKGNTSVAELMENLIVLSAGIAKQNGIIN